MAEASAAWPSFELSTDVFLAYLAERVPFEAPVEEGLQSLHVADLYLACACSRRDEHAIACFEEAHTTTIAMALSGMGNLGSIEEEVRQRLREKLFVPSGAPPAKIAGYFGRGALRSWVRASAIREALSLVRKSKREVLGKDEYLAGLPSLADDPEMMHLKGLYRGVFKTAFEAAFAGLSARDRTLLRYKYCDASTLDEMASLYRVHRATVARWLADIRENLLAQTRERMKLELATSDSELDSIMRVIQSKLDISIADELEA